MLVKPPWACSWSSHEHLCSWKLHEHAHEALMRTCAWRCHAHDHFRTICSLDRSGWDKSRKDRTHIVLKWSCAWHLHAHVRMKASWACSWSFHEHKCSWELHEHAHGGFTSTMIDLNKHCMTHHTVRPKSDMNPKTWTGLNHPPPQTFLKLQGTAGG